MDLAFSRLQQIENLFCFAFALKQIEKEYEEEENRKKKEKRAKKKGGKETGGDSEANTAKQADTQENAVVEEKENLPKADNKKNKGKPAKKKVFMIRTWLFSVEKFDSNNGSINY